MKIESKPEALKFNQNMKIGKNNMYGIDTLVTSANKIIDSFNYDVSYNRASMVRDIIEAAIISDVVVLKIEDRSFSIRELIEKENPEMYNLTNLMQIIFDEDTVDAPEDLKDFLIKTTYDILCEMEEEIEDELNEEEFSESTIDEFDSIINSYVISEEKREFEGIYYEAFDESIDSVFCKIDSLNDFISDNNLNCSDFTKRFKSKIKHLPKYRQIRPLYFYDKFTYRKITKQLKFFVDSWEKFLIHYPSTKNNKFTYSDFEKQIFNFIK
ncbi:hypothetical protein MCG45_16105 [Clostridium perfringens]|uniref:hypothetical protein n=1 Tax=Clostridium perfringens TaxID=1502 RepID=UPI001F06A118|nr:hypothetical protein [Clostridium perfringens]MCH1964353.1 hypothetical protein [Clostridium perfringens]